MTLPDEPKGWERLQVRAQRAKCPRQLARVVDQMNRLLDRQQRLSAAKVALPGQEPRLEVVLQLYRPAA